MEDFSYINRTIKGLSKTQQELLAAKNTWEVSFYGYDDDPREVYDIPEIVNWIERSIDEGIPWFYFMSGASNSLGLSTFLVCCCGEHDPKNYRRMLLEKNRVLNFINRNFENLNQFLEMNHLPLAIGEEITDTIMEPIYNILNGMLDGENAGDIDPKKQFKEALERLDMLEKSFDLNPKVKKYFNDGKLYYSYITGGGLIGSIDTITYDERYEQIVEAFQNQTSFLVYHVIERGDTIALLYVSDDYNKWQDERPFGSLIQAYVVDLNTYEAKPGYIKIDCFNNALYRINDKIYDSRPKEVELGELGVYQKEIVERLEILKSIGLDTDLDITKIYLQEHELCCSKLAKVYGQPVGVVNKISSQPLFEELLNWINENTDKKVYFVMDANVNEIAFLYISDEEDLWDFEKDLLEKRLASGYVINLDEKSIKEVEGIYFEMINGGPIYIS